MSTALIRTDLPGVQTRAQTNRVGNVDVLRAVAALAILVIHAYALGGRVVPVKAQYWYDVPLGALASGVWLFFAISGYVISRPFIDRLLTRKPLPALVPYALRRALRIYPLYWLALTALIVIGGIAGTRLWQLPVHYLLLNNLIPGRQEALFPQAWTLTLEVLFYCSLPLLAALVRATMSKITAERLALLVIFSWAASIAFTAFADLQGAGQLGLWLRGSLPAMWQMFCPGILLAIAPHLTVPRLRRITQRSTHSGVVAAVCAATLPAAAVLSAAAPLRFGVVTYQLLADAARPLFAIGYGILIAWAIAHRPWHAQWAARLGLASYGIYLLHPVIALLLTHEGASPLANDSLVAFLVNTLCLAGLTIPAALLSWNWLERPAIALGHRLSRRYSRDRPRT